MKQISPKKRGTIMDALRSYHNEIKTALIEKARGMSPAYDIVLDIACGPASDVFKYGRMGIRHFVGVDKDADALSEGERRFRGSDAGSVETFELHHSDRILLDIGTFSCPHGGGWPLLSCQFAIQYFMEDTTRFSRFCKGLADIARTGGILYGTVMDADRVRRLVGTSSSSYSNSMCEISLAVPGRISVRLLGNTRYYMGRAVDEPAATSDSIIEPMLEAGFSLVEWKNFLDYGGEARGLRQDAKIVSELYCTFMFKKK